MRDEKLKQSLKLVAIGVGAIAFVLIVASFFGSEREKPEIESNSTVLPDPVILSDSNSTSKPTMDLVKLKEIKDTFEKNPSMVRCVLSDGKEVVLSEEWASGDKIFYEKFEGKHSADTFPETVVITSCELIKK